MQVASILAASMSHDNAKIWRVMGRRIDRNKPGQGLKVEILEMSRVRLEMPVSPATHTAVEEPAPAGGE